MKIGRREVGEIVRGCVDRKKSSFLGSPRDVFRRPSAAPEPIAPKFLHTTFPSKYFVLAEFHPPRLSFGGVMPPTPSFASLQYGLPYSMAGHNNNNQDNVYGAVIMAEPLREFTWFI